MSWKADFHIHSKYSDKPTNWAMKQFGCPEAFSEPKEIYKIAKNMGMNAVTITDHDQIDGCLEIMEHPDAFMGTELSVKFPEDKCKFHLLAYDFNEDQFKDLLELKNNVYELQEYLLQNNIYHSVAHPFYSVNDKLKQEHLEKIMLLFNSFELNGCRVKSLNDGIIKYVASLTPQVIEKYSNIHGIKPIENPLNKSFIGGSDDHTSIMIARKHTKVEQAENISDFLKKVFIEGQGIVEGKDYSPNGLAHNMYSIAYQYYLSKYKVEKFVTKDPALKIVDRLLTNKQRGDDVLSKLVSKLIDKTMKSDISDIIDELKRNSIKRVLYKTVLNKHAVITQDAAADNLPDKWFEIANSALNIGVNHMMEYLLSIIKRGNVFDIFHALGSVGSTYFLMSPYFVAYSVTQKDRQFTNKVINSIEKKDKQAKIAHFTDTYYDINGVAKTMQQNLKIAKKLNKNLTIITCENTESSKYKNLEGEVAFNPIGQSEIPEYPELKFNYPPFLEMLKYCYEGDFTHFHSATPGPVGLAALAISKILKMPIYGTYHTAFPQFVLNLTGDPTMERVGWQYMIWYYNQMDIVYVPSKAMGKELVEKGIDERKIKLYPRGVDINRFQPVPAKKEKQNLTLLYTGRVSKEKNLHLLTAAFKELSEEDSSIKLQIVGGGPYKEEMEASLKGLNVEFTGYVHGDDLVQVYSDADIFVFPSTTDTFGNVALEAQACGTPVIVTDKGGPMENLLNNETGIIIKGDDEKALLNGIKKMLDREKLDTMSAKCREYMKGRSFESAFLETWHLYETGI